MLPPRISSTKSLILADSAVMLRSEVPTGSTFTRPPPASTIESAMSVVVSLTASALRWAQVPHLACVCALDGYVQCEDVGLEDDLVDDLDDR